VSTVSVSRDLSVPQFSRKNNIFFNPQIEVILDIISALFGTRFFNLLGDFFFNLLGDFFSTFGPLFFVFWGNFFSAFCCALLILILVINSHFREHFFSTFGATFF